MYLKMIHLYSPDFSTTEFVNLVKFNKGCGYIDAPIISREWLNQSELYINLYKYLIG